MEKLHINKVGCSQPKHSAEPTHGLNEDTQIGRSQLNHSAELTYELNRNLSLPGYHIEPDEELDDLRSWRRDGAGWRRYGWSAVFDDGTIDDTMTDPCCDSLTEDSFDEDYEEFELEADDYEVWRELLNGVIWDINHYHQERGGQHAWGLNGNNGSWTNTDDVEKKKKEDIKKCVDPTTCNHSHSHVKSTRGGKKKGKDGDGEKKEKSEAEKYAQARIAAKDLIKCESCPHSLCPNRCRKDEHYHTVDDYIDEPVCGACADKRRSVSTVEKLVAKITELEKVSEPTTPEAVTPKQPTVAQKVESKPDSSVSTFTVPTPEEVKSWYASKSWLGRTREETYVALSGKGPKWDPVQLEQLKDRLVILYGHDPLDMEKVKALRANKAWKPKRVVRASMESGILPEVTPLKAEDVGVGGGGPVAQATPHCVGQEKIGETTPCVGSSVDTNCALTSASAIGEVKNNTETSGVKSPCPEKDPDLPKMVDVPLDDSDDILCHAETRNPIHGGRYALLPVDDTNDDEKERPLPSPSELTDFSQRIKQTINGGGEFFRYIAGICEDGYKQVKSKAETPLLSESNGIYHVGIDKDGKLSLTEDGKPAVVSGRFSNEVDLRVVKTVIFTRSDQGEHITLVGKIKHTLAKTFLKRKPLSDLGNLGFVDGDFVFNIFHMTLFSFHETRTYDHMHASDYRYHYKAEIYLDLYLELLNAIANQTFFTPEGDAQRNSRAILTGTATRESFLGGRYSNIHIFGGRIVNKYTDRNAITNKEVIIVDPAIVENTYHAVMCYVACVNSRWRSAHGRPR